MLTDTAIKNAKPAEKPSKLADEKGLYLLVNPSGGKLWRMKYRFEGKEKLLSFGAYPDVSLKEARERRDEARKLLANGADPGAARKAQKTARLERAANSFETVAREWFEQWKADKAEGHARTAIARLEQNVFPYMGGSVIADIKAPEVLAVLRRIEERGIIETAHRVKTVISQVMRYAIATGRREERDPCPDLKGALQVYRGKNMAAITDPVRVGALLRAIADYKGTPVVRAALRLAPLVFVRPGELRTAKWADIDLEKAEWRYTTSKTGTEHLVPLAPQAVAILQDLHPITGHDKSGFVFSGVRAGRPLSDATLNRALQNMGYDTRTEMTGHGFRAMARTLLAEVLHFPPEWIEHQLAHAVPDTLGTAYNRTKYLKERREMMQAWADYLDKLKAGADVIPLRQAI
ncbi:MAG: integrase arm-type DNA-binding domain-containing protein [Zoogloeaceae bacterium]|jgi:integrase|nr:integrase arm-type DNA-binding domain-containing protein [Zoogloeaceae bacterium]